MARYLFCFSLCCGVLFANVRARAQSQWELLVADMPAHGALRVLPENRGLIYVGTGTDTDGFSFCTADDNGVGWVDVSVTSDGEDVLVECEDSGGPVVTGLSVQACGSGSDTSNDDPTGTPIPKRPDSGLVLIILVDQPGDGGDRDVWEGPFWDPDVGHSFLQLVNCDTGAVRTIGLHATGQATPLSPTCPGAILDDSAHDWDVQYNIPLTEEQYNDLMDEINSDVKNPPQYDLNDFNCTDYVLSLVKKIGIQLNSRAGTWPNGGGDNPGDFGQDLLDQGGIPSSENGSNTGSSDGSSSSTIRS